MKEKIYLDYSKMSLYQGCPRKYFISEILHLGPPQEAAPLEFGAMFHEVLSVWYQTSDPKQAIQPIMKYEDREEFADRLTQEQALRIFNRYAVQYEHEPFEIIANEVIIEEKIGEDDTHEYYLIGAVDLVVHWLGTDFVYGVDHKTTSRLGDSFMVKFDLDPQMTGYTWALRKLYGPRVQGMLVNAISTAKTAGTGKTQMFSRVLASRSGSKLDNYERHTLNLMQDITNKTWAWNTICRDNKDELRDELFIPNFTACNNYGKCQYKDACIQDLHPDYMRTNFVTRVWDPRDKALARKLMNAE